MLRRPLRLLLILLALVLALGMLWRSSAWQDGPALNLSSGNAILVATLLLGVGWAGLAGRQRRAERRRLKALAQAAIAVLETHAAAFAVSLSDDELEHFRRLAPAIAEGHEPEAIPVRPADPFVGMPEASAFASLLSAETVQYLVAWRYKSAEMFALYDLLGSRKMSSLGAGRLDSYHNYMARCRRVHLNLAYTAASLLEEEVPGVRLNHRMFKGAVCLAPPRDQTMVLRALFAVVVGPAAIATILHERGHDVLAMLAAALRPWW